MVLLLIILTLKIDAELQGNSKLKAISLMAKMKRSNTSNVHSYIQDFVQTFPVVESDGLNLVYYQMLHSIYLSSAKNEAFIGTVYPKINELKR